MTMRWRSWAGFAALAAIVLLASGCGGGRPRAAHHPQRFIREHGLGNLPRFDIPIEINDRVIAWMEYFQGPGRNHFQRYLERSGRYVPLMQEILRKNSMPADLVYIALIESGFNTQARSHASAVGPWQFISSTGRRYGLRIDGYVDKRRDPYESTQAAVEYFRDLYREFGDWYLAMAGYNGGEGRVRNAIEAGGTKNFWELTDNRSLFRAETRDYVPKFIAAAIMAKTPERFGFSKVQYLPPFDFETDTVETQTDLDVVARCAGVSESDIVDLNPHLIGGSTPPDGRNYEIRLPRGTSKSFRERYAALPKEERIQIARYEVRRGDTLARVARRYGISARALAAANGLSAKQRRLPVGTTLTIPSGRRAAMLASADAERSRSAGEGGKRTVHVVRRGETLGAIARRYDVSAQELVALNGLRSAKKIHPGMRLTVRRSRGEPSASGRAETEGAAQGGASSPGTVHRVSRGETLATIASRYGVTVKQLTALNQLSGPKGLRAGMRLTIRKPKAVAKEAVVAEKAVPEPSSPGESPKVSAPESAAASHRVNKGETLSQIAVKYGVGTKELMAMNGIRDPRSVRAGTTLIVKKKEKGVPPAPTSALPEAAARPSAPVVLEAEEAPVSSPEGKLPPAPQDQPVPPTSGSLSDSIIPMQPQTTAIDLREGDVPGTRAKEQAPAAARPADVSGSAPRPLSTSPAEKPAGARKIAGAATYQVKSGDTLWDIARRHKVSIAKIQQWNRLADPSAVKPGTMLSIRQP